MNTMARDINKIVQQAESLYSQRKYEQALTILKSGYEYSPEDPDLNKMLGLVYDRFKDYEKAVDHFKKAYDKNKHDPSILEYYAYALYYTDRHDEAASIINQLNILQGKNYLNSVEAVIAHYSRLMQNNPVYWTRLNNEGWQLLISGKIDFAKKIAQYLISTGKQENDMERMYVGMDLLAVSLTHSNNIEDIKQAISLFQEVEKVSTSILSPVIYKKAQAKFKRLSSGSTDSRSSSIQNFCTNCGQKVEPSFNFCKKCGAPLKKKQVDEVITKSKPQTKEIPLWEQLYDEGTNLLNSRRLNEALDKFHQALELKNDDHELLTNTGVVYLHLGRFEEGMKWLDRALEIEPNHPMALLNKGMFYSIQTKYDEAVEALERLLKFNPNFSRAKGMLMEAKRQQKLFATIKDKQIPLKAVEQFRQGIQYFQSNQTERAMSTLKLAILDYPQFAEAFLYLGLINIERGSINNGLDYLDKALEIDPTLVRAWSTKGWAYDKKKQFQEAIKCYDEAIKIDPFFSSAWNNKGLALASLEKHDEAIKAYEKAIELNPDYVGSYHNLGVAYKKTGQVERAIKNYQKVLELEPHNEEAKENIERLRHYSSPHEEGVIRTVVDARDYCPRCNQKNYTNSEKCPNCGALMYSENVEELLREGVELSAIGNFEQALTKFIRINDKEPTNSETWFYRGKAHCALAEFQNALACFAKAQEFGFRGMQLMMYGLTAKTNFSNFKRPDLSEKHIEELELKSSVYFPDEEAWLAQGAAYQMLMQYEEAYKSYQKALKIKPDYGPARKNLDFIKKLAE